MLVSVIVGGCCFMVHSSAKSFLPYARYLLPRLLRELGLQACSTTSGYAVNLTLIVCSIISSSHFAVQCPLGTGQASKMAK